MTIGDKVIMPTPEEFDTHTEEFVGTIIDIDNDDREEMAAVEDEDGYIFDIELYRLRYAPNQE